MFRVFDFRFFFSMFRIFVNSGFRDFRVFGFPVRFVGFWLFRVQVFSGLDFSGYRVFRGLVFRV